MTAVCNTTRQVQPINVSDEAAISVVYKNDKGEVFHTCSCHERGIDVINGAYQFLDLVPKRRDEETLESSMAWIRRHDEY